MKVDEPDTKYMFSIERVLAPSVLLAVFRRDIVERSWS